MKSSDAKASKCHLKSSSLMMIFIKLVYLSSVISLNPYAALGTFLVFCSLISLTILAVLMQMV